MKSNFISILLLLITLNSLGQPIEDVGMPFQVLFAENVMSKDGSILKSLDFISAEETLSIQKDGSISLIHKSGIPIEISNDTIISIVELNNLLQNDISGKRRRLKQNNSHSLVRLGIEFLFFADKKLANYTKLSSTGSCMDCNFDFEIIYPPHYLLAYSDSSDLCIKWEPSDALNYSIELGNPAKTVIKKYTSTFNELTINWADLQFLTSKGTSIIVEIMGDGLYKRHGGTEIKKFGDNDIKFPFGCQIETATAALLMGLYMEISPNSFLKKYYTNEAEKYYTLAASLSEKHFFKEMLNNFRMRQGK